MIQKFLSISDIVKSLKKIKKLLDCAMVYLMCYIMVI